jgi:hypothetical protein
MAQRAASGSDTNTRAPMRTATWTCICPMGPAPITSRSSATSRPTRFSDRMQQATGSAKAASSKGRPAGNG